MSIRSKADWLRGFLESLEYSDSISKGQIQLLKTKLNSLLEEIESDDDLDEDVDEDIKPSNLKEFRNSEESFDLEDDLPF